MDEVKDIEKIYLLLDSYDFVSQMRIIKWLNSRLQSDENERMHEAAQELGCLKEKVT